LRLSPQSRSDSSEEDQLHSQEWGHQEGVTVDNKSTNILGFYATFCTVVTGE
jgi:hypothetical protein